MKKVVMISAAVLLMNFAQAQKIKETEVPKPVLESFKTNFAGAKAKEWKKEENNTFEAEFDWNKEETSATFAADGILKETEQEIKTSALPASVHDYVSKNYSAFKLTEASKITTPDKKVTYEAEVEKGKESFDLIFDATGNFLRKE
jgi:hypothetical protein